MSGIPPKIPVRADADCPTHARSEVACGKHTLIIDEPEERGGTDLGPSPMEVLMASYASCTNVIMNVIAEERGYTITDVSVKVVGHLDRRAITGEEKVSTPFPDVRLSVVCKTDASEEGMESLKEELAWRCPASATLRGSGSHIKEKWDITYA